MCIVFRSLSVLLSAILAAGSCLEAQTTTAPAGNDEVRELHIRVLEAENGKADTTRSSSQPITVVVTDAGGAPVASATVLFRLPSEPPTGVFSDGSRVAVLYTDMEGHAVVKNIQWTGSSGTAVIRVTASKGTAHAGLLIEQVLGRSSADAASPAAPVAVASVPAKPTSVVPAPATAAPAATQSAGIVHPAPVGQPAPAQQESAAKPLLISTTGVTTHTGASGTEEPSVLITNNHPTQMTGAGGRSKKWLWIGIGGAAAAGLAVAFVGKGGAGSNSSQTSGSPSLSIGTPTISIGHP
jgi:hypothetical protein